MILFNYSIRRTSGFPKLQRVPTVFFAREIHSVYENAFGEAIIASPFPAPEVLVHMGVTLFGRRPNGVIGFRLPPSEFQTGLPPDSGIRPMRNLLLAKLY